jgi:hypothetical protein
MASWFQMKTTARFDVLVAKIYQSFPGAALDKAVRDANCALQEMRSLNFGVEESLAANKP